MKTNLLSKLCALCVLLMLGTAEAATNIALNKTAVAGATEGVMVAGNANDGNVETRWGSNQGAATHPDVDWWYVDLAGFYTLDSLRIMWEGAHPTNYELQVATTSVSSWTTFSHITTEPASKVLVTYVVPENTTARFIRVKSNAATFENQYGISIFEFEAYGEAVPDTEAPVLTAAAFVSATHNSAVISISATDNIAVTKCTVTDATNSIDSEFAVVDGNMTVTGLTPETAYNLVIKAKDGAGNVSEASKTVTFTTTANLSAPTVAAPVPPTYADAKVIVVFSDVNNKPVNWGYCEGWGQSTTLEMIQIGSDNILKYSNCNYLGMAAASDINALTMDTLHIDIWCETDFSPRLYPICRTQTNGEQFYTLNVTAREWNSFNIPISYFTEKGLDMSGVFQFKIDNGSNKTFYVDNLYFYKYSATADTEKPANLTATLLSTSYYNAIITCSATDNSGSVIFTVYNGETPVGTGGAVSGVATNVTASNLTPGTAYNFTVKATDADGNECATSAAVATTTKALPAAAPTPTKDAANVISLYSNAYTAAATFGVGGWGQTTVQTEIELATGDNAYMLSKFNYLGWEINGNTAAFDATEMKYLHIDVYADNLTKFQLTPIWGGEALYTCTPITSNAWNSFDIPLSSFTGINLANIYQIKFVAEPSNTALVFLDNIYFWKDCSTNINVAQNSTLPIIAVDGNTIQIQQQQAAPVAVYNLTGACVYNNANAGTELKITLDRGLYLVCAGTKTAKLLVK